MIGLSQIELIGAILNHLDRVSIKTMNQRQYNAVVAAADIIIAAFAKPHTKAPAACGLAAWLASDSTGLSSSYMAWVLAPLAGVGHAPLLRGFNYQHPPYPHDAGDFGRCVTLLDSVPQLRPHLPAMSQLAHGPQWAALVTAWDELEVLYRAEVAGGELRLTKRMREMFDAAGKAVSA